MLSKWPSWPSIATVVAVLRLLGLRDFDGIDLFAREATQGFYAEMDGWNCEEFWMGSGRRGKYRRATAYLG